MRNVTCLIGLLLVLGGCRKPAETTASETRPATMRDHGLKLDATSRERFGGASGMPEPSGPAPESPVKATHVPEGWTVQPGNAFRLLNYSFGEKGEVSVSLSRGGVIDNVNRWFGQIGLPTVDAAGLDGLEKLQVAGFDGVWLQGEGDYSPGMGQPTVEAYGLRGVVAERGGEILTVKMVGPAGEVAGAEDGLRAFVAGLEPIE